VRDTALYHKVADVAVNTSMHDSFNVSLAESLACGVPVVSSETSGVMELVRGKACAQPLSYPAGALAEFRDCREVAPEERSMKAVREFLAQLSERGSGELSQMARSAIGGRCAPEVLAPRWLELMRN
jgi:glycosyltransferase involved in cell wall biosynthesis